MGRRFGLHPLLLPVVFLLASACDKDDGPVDPPVDGELFDRYVALGNSITAGFESAGINDSTQVHSYSNLLAESFAAPFNLPLLRRPGCPAPLTGPQPLTEARVGGADEDDCAGFQTPIPQLVQNLAFPGFRIGEALTVPGGALGLLYRQAIGSRSLVQAMADANPTLVSVWLGNNDALSAATSGNTAELTSLASFETSLGSIISVLKGEAAMQGAVLFGVLDPQMAPLLQPGAYLWVSGGMDGEDGWLTKPVSGDCAPSGSSGEPNPLASNLVSLRVLEDDGVTEISCADDAPYVLTADEQAEIGDRVEQFNQAIRDGAQANGWIYIDPTDEIALPLLADPDRLRKCQSLDLEASEAEMQQAVLESCPHPDAPNFFGSSVSFDGVHPSEEGQTQIAEVLRAKIVARHGSDL